MEEKFKRVFFIKPNEKLSFSIDDFLGEPFAYQGEGHGVLFWNKESKEFNYIPEKDYTGKVNLVLQYSPDDNGILQKSINLEIQVAHTFKPRARIIKIIGQELISNDVIALVELIKNSYDADSTIVDIKLNNIFSDEGEIIIADNGSGMTYEKITNVWLEPATPDKKINGNKSYSQCFNRTYLGEKGIGRFAVHRLGDKIELVSRAKKTCSGELYEYETKVIINWQEFSEEKYLDQIPIIVHKIDKPSTFIDNSGTSIRISGVTPWISNTSVIEAVTKIKSLESPIKVENIKDAMNKNASDPGFIVNVSSNLEDLNNKIIEIKSIEQLLDTAFYKMTAKIDSSGRIFYRYTFEKPGKYQANRIHNKDVPPIEDNLKKYEIEWFEEHPLNDANTPGEFTISLYAWDLDSASLKVAGLADYYRRIIKPNAGIRIFRDKFRVWPYGETDDDWLELDITRLNAPRERSVSRNQVFGAIQISSVENPELQDQSNREGLIVNEQYRQFYHLVSAAIAVFARERKSDKINLDKLIRRGESENDVVANNILMLREKVDQNSHTKFYAKDIDNIEKSYSQKLNDILERYMMAAAIGISYTIPIHELNLRLTSIRHFIGDIQKHPQYLDKYLKELFKYVEDTEEILTAVSSIMSKQRKQKVSLERVAKNIETLKSSELKKFNIAYEIIGNDIEVDAVPGLLNTAVLNLVDNSIYWLRTKREELKKANIPYNPKIVVEIGHNNDNKRTTLKVKDNGPGFQDPIELLIEPYYSRKTNGFGLGLHLVNEIVMRLGGSFTGYNDDGAVFEITF